MRTVRRPDRRCPGESRPPALQGRVALVSMFIGSDGRSWTDSEIARWTTSIERVARWMEQEADRYGAGVAVGVADTYFRVEGDRTPEVDIGAAWEGAGVGLFEMNSITRSLTLMSRAAAQLGFHDSVDLVREVARGSTARSPSGCSTSAAPDDRSRSPSISPSWTASAWPSATHAPIPSPASSSDRRSRTPP